MTDRWLERWDPIDGPVDPLPDDHLVDLFARSRLVAAERAAERLTRALPFDIAQLSVDEPEEALGILALPGSSDDALATIERAVQLAWGPGRRPPRLAHPEAMHVLRAADRDADVPSDDRGPGPGVDPRETAHLLTRLDDGWMLEVPGLAEVVPALRDLVADIEAFADVMTDVVGWYGIRSALGPPPVPVANRRLIVQLAGQRQITVTTAASPEPRTVRVGPMMAALVPPAASVHHLPLDADSLHVEIVIPPGDDPGRDRSRRQAMQPARTTSRLAIARAVVEADPAVGHLFRWAAPGGVHVLSGPDARAVELAAGGRRLRVVRDAIPVLAEVAAGDWMRASDLDGPTGVVGAFLEDLWRAGLLEPAPGTPPPRPPERVNRVGHADLFDVERCAGILDGVSEPWRPPEPHEVHPTSPGVEVAELRDDDVRAAIGGIVAQINRRIFRFDLEGWADDDPVLIVRFRADGPDPGALAVGDFQPDTDESRPGRKLTFALPLDGDPDGAGRVRMAGGSDTVTASPGRISVFASFRPWALEVPDRSVRHLLLGRLHGPGFA